MQRWFGISLIVYSRSFWKNKRNLCGSDKDKKALKERKQGGKEGLRDEDGGVEKREEKASEATDSNKTRGEGGKQDIQS